MRTRPQILKQAASPSPSPSSSLLFRCGCGRQTPSMEEFREHSLSVHLGQYMHGSTHFLSSFTQIVLPSQQTLPHSPYLQEQSKQNFLFQDYELLTQQDNHNVRFQGNCSTKKKDSSQQQTPNRKRTIKIINEANTASVSAKDERLLADKIIQSNGFRLVRNELCTFGPYFCGFCQITFVSAQNFIAHCIESCKQLQNPLSSHYFCKGQNQGKVDNTQNFRDLNDIDDDETVPLQEQLQALDNPYKNVNDRKESDRCIDPILKIIQHKLDDRKEPFYCGFCNQSILNVCKYSVHISNRHNEIMHNSNSHIILRIRHYLRIEKIQKVYISKSMKWAEYGPVYYCQCKPNLKMTMSSLFEHVMLIHKGISPIYKYLKRQTQPSQIQNNVRSFLPSKADEKRISFQLKSQISELISKFPVLKTLKAKKKRINIEKHNIRLFLKHSPTILNHQKMVPFQCYQCNKNFQKKIGYLLHLHRGSQNHSHLTKHSFSHVIIRTRFFEQQSNRCLYVSPQLNWPNQQRQFYCPCQPDQLVSMKDLLQHIISIHQFLSPVYYPRIYQGKP